MDLTVIATGGTIDCVRENGVLKVGQTDLAPYIGAHKIIRPFRILSENATFTHYERLVTLIRGLKTAGVLVTHGSDTLPYTAAALGFCLADSKIPVVVTAADAPLNESGSNAAENLAAAMRVIESGVPGVYVSYANRGCEADIYYGVRMNEARDFDGVYTAPGGSYFARRGGRERLGAPLSGASLAPVFGRVNAFRFIPGMQYRTDGGPVLIMGTHSGTAAQSVLAGLAENNPDVYLCGGTAGLTYESKAALRGRVHFLDNIAWPAAYIKASLVYGAYPPEIAREKLAEPVAGEFFA